MISGKSIMSWNVPAIYGGDPDKYVEVLSTGRFESVDIKAGDGNGIYKMSSFSPWPNWGENVTTDLIVALRTAGFRVNLWHFVYGTDVHGELAVAKLLCDRFQPDGYIWNVEGAFDRKPNAIASARFISQGLKQAYPHITQGLCWWALPISPSTGSQWHPIAVAKAFLETVDVGMPMMYWQGIGATAARNYLYTSLRIWRENVTDKPIVPIGRCWDGAGGYADPDGITGFGLEVLKLADLDNLVGNSWYSLDKAFTKMTWFNALQDLPKWGTIVRLSIEEKVARLVAAHPELFPEFF